MPAQLDELEDLETLHAVASHLDDVGLKELSSRIFEIAVRASWRFHRATSKSVAAAFLEVQDDTLNAWLRKKIVYSVHIPSSPKEFVEIESLLQVRPHLRALRAAGRIRNLSGALEKALEGIDKGEIITQHKLQQAASNVLEFPAYEEDEEEEREEGEIET